ncbi:pilus assembly FimT family protein, partial [Stenotrophomonas maltophilia]|uniref:pilus assembly FimT family protein n=1 Tax=Stenotrophomonas maltophilia TaxID=40324 RepID=UPI00066B6FB0
MMHFLPRRLPRPRLHGWRAAGLSLLEMLLVIALIAAIGLITAAGLSRGFAGMQLRSAGKDIANQLRMVRAQAIARGEPQRFVIEPARHRWQGANQRQGDVPTQLQVQFEAGRLPTFSGTTDNVD